MRKADGRMVDLEHIIGFQWDESNEKKSYDKHGVSKVESEQIFSNDDQLKVLEDPRHSRSESRFHALGMTDRGRRLHVTFTLREDDTMIRVISAREMSRKERRFTRMMTNRTLKPIPDFKSEAEERAFWESHDSTDYVDWREAERVRFPNLKPSSKSISLRMPLDLLERIKIAANKRDVPYQSLIKIWLAEKVDSL